MPLLRAPHRRTNAGVDDKFMKQLGENLPEGSAALILLIRKVSADKLLPEFKIPGTVIQTSLSDDQAAQLRDALAAAGRE